nr:Chain E, CATALYTIC DOMAIN OF THE NUCLEAR INCLUSION PROTEIN A (NIA) [Tobacco etch virus]
EATQLMN